jgi:hypothetical protein
VRGALEQGVPVAEGEVAVRQRAHPTLPAVVQLDARHGVGDLAAVRTDVLDGGRPDAAGDTGQRLEAREAAVDGEGDQLVPARTGLHGHVRASAVVGALQRHPAVLGPGDVDDGAREPGVGDDQVGPARDQEQPVAPGVDLATAASSSSLSRATTSRRAGPPTRRVVRSARRPPVTVVGALTGPG